VPSPTNGSHIYRSTAPSVGGMIDALTMQSSQGG
jgi:hypothetical protein